MVNRFRAGDLIGKYRVSAAVPNGYRAEHLQNGRSALIKLELIEELSNKLDRAMRVRDALIDHPGVAHVVECGALPDGQPWIASELPEGLVLYDLIVKRMLRVEEVASLIHDVASVLAYAHERGVVHGNLRLHSIVLTDGVSPVSIGEWGDVLDEANGRTARPSTAFTAPESIDGPGDGRIDVYALGVIAYRALTGRFPGYLTTNVPGAPAALAQVMLRMLVSDPELRPTAREVVAAIKLLLCGEVPMDDEATVNDVVEQDIPLEAIKVIVLTPRFKQPRWTPPTHLAKPQEVTPQRVDPRRAPSDERE